DAQAQPSEHASLDKDIQDSEYVIDKEGQHQMPEDEHDKPLKKKRGELHLKRRQLKLPVLTNSVLIGHFAASTSTGANTNESSFVYLGGKIPIDASTLPNADLPIDPNMPDLEDASETLLNDGIFNEAYDDNEDVDAVADINNMDNTIVVSPILKLRIHKDHLKGQILGDPSSAVQTRGKIHKASSVQQALKEIGTKWVFRNKRDDRSIVVKIKARLVAQGFVHPAHPNKVYKVVKALYGLHQAPRASYETLSSFLLENGFRRDDIIFGSTKKSLCTEFEEVKQQPDGIFISQDKYVADILKKFDFCSIKTATTPIESNKPLVKDEDGVEVDVHKYRSMIGSLMYLC
ncbi:putative ribonuclease H-like domain-containing protein, partial [Tanacetum coccineum]